MFIYEQFQNPAVSIAAKLYLYDLLAISHDIHSGQVKDFMQELRETDLNNLLLQASKEEQVVFEKDTASRIMQMLQRATPGTIKQEAYFLLSLLVHL